MSDRFIGIDVGGTKIASATLSGGRLSESRLVETSLEDRDALIEQLVQAIEDLRDVDVRAVGVGVPSVVDFATGRIRSSVNIPLEDVPLRELLTDRVGLPVFVENDASAAALAEAFEDGELTCPHLVMFTIGTGVGGGTVLDGRVYRGATGAAPEIGHQIIGLDLSEGDQSSQADFPQPGSLEALASGRALDRLALDAARRQPDSYLGRRLAAVGEVTGVDAVDGATEGDDAARGCVEILGERLGVGIANAINLYDPLEVVIGGGVSRAGDLLLEPAERAAFRHVLPGVGTKTKIRLARHGPQAGVLGAALIAAQEHSSKEGGK
ncbi:MAG TPA: ROK family protein [Solirubrobacteraceae bacterium]|nr:ROK family protein [Solirubrobacteraceae bacterium]